MSSIIKSSVDESYRLAPLFFFSGFAALVYQICWQRLLFASFGVDLESVTIIVSAFMMGLGLGSLVGGYLADMWPTRTVQLFATSEVCIGIFGWFSPELLQSAGEYFVKSDSLTIAMVNFLLLLIPTSLMGSTLPILVSNVTRKWKNVGKSIGFLYQINTLGAALAVLTMGFLWFLFFELNTAIRAAAILNIMISLGTLAWIKKDV